MEEKPKNHCIGSTPGVVHQNHKQEMIHYRELASMNIIRIVVKMERSGVAIFSHSYYTVVQNNHNFAQDPSPMSKTKVLKAIHRK